MTEKKEPKKAAAPKAAAPKAAKPAAPKKAEAKKAPAKSGKTVSVTQIGSPIGRQAFQRGTLIGLGLGKLHKTSELEDTAAVRGMIYAVRHLVKVNEAA